MSRTMESVCNNIYGKEAKVFMAHNLPLPICFNYAIQKAINEYDPDYFWFVEEDMLIPDGTLDTLLALDTHACGVDYADRRTGKRLSFVNKKGDCLYTGMGCLLLKREVVDKLPIPWLKRMVFWLVETDDGDVDYLPKPDIAPTGYGSQDIYLSHKIREMGYKIILNTEIKVGHMQLEVKGEDIKNNGADEIKIVYVDGDNPYKMGEIGTEELSKDAPNADDILSKK